MMDTNPIVRAQDRSCLDRKENMILSVLLSLVVLVGGVNIIALMMERGMSGVADRERVSSHLDQFIEKNSELTQRYDSLSIKHADLIRDNADLTRRYGELIDRYEFIIGRLDGIGEGQHGKPGKKP